jgi:hypothetical protein
MTLLSRAQVYRLDADGVAHRVKQQFAKEMKSEEATKSG